MIDFIRPPHETRIAHETSESETCELESAPVTCCGTWNWPQKCTVTISGVGVGQSDCPYCRLLPVILGAISELLGPLTGRVELTITIKP